MEQNQQDDYYNVYDRDEEEQEEKVDFFKDFEIGSVEVNSSLRTYQHENEIEEENIQNVQEPKMSLTEVTKDKTKK